MAYPLPKCDLIAVADFALGNRSILNCGNTLVTAFLNEYDSGDGRKYLEMALFVYTVQ